ncbi:MAG: hypothetical protein ACHQK8_08480 [Bacteroidia bacterium]
MKKLFYVLLAFYFLIACSKSSSDNSTSQNNTTPCTGAQQRSAVEKIQKFPADYPLNTDISGVAVDANSSNIINAIGVYSVHPDFGSGLYNGAPIGIPFSAVCASQPKVPITYRANSYDGNYGTESDPGPFPIPDSAAIEGNGNGDSHVLVCDVENKKLYELYNASKNSGSGWSASSGAVFDLITNYYRTDGWTSADAAGLPILPCLLRYDEVASGNINHAIRFTLSKPHVFNGYVNPARHKVSGTGAANLSLPMGARIRLKSTFDASSYSANNKVILTALKKYGLILADIGSDLYISGAPDERWDNNELNQLKNLKTTDFEVVQIGTIK